MQRFHCLPFAAQCLYVRLISRVGPWFRCRRLVYEELGDLNSAFAALAEADLLLVAQELLVGELGKLYTHAELQQALASSLERTKFKDKASLLLAIEKLGLEAAALTAQLRNFDGQDIVAPQGAEQVQLLQLLFFGNRRQSLTEFVLSDLGVASYFPYHLDRGQRLFASRIAVDEYLACAALSDCWYTLREEEDAQALLQLSQLVLDKDVHCASTENRWFRLCNGLARDLERQGENDRALALYARSLQHPSRERRTRILEKAGRWREALALCDDIRGNPWCEQERDAAARILPRVRRKLQLDVPARAREKFNEMQLCLAQTGGPVELVAAEALLTQWQSVHYVENTLMNTLFGLAFWEQIFAPLPGAFHNPYQSAPGDMYEPGFRQRRQHMLDARLQELRSVPLQQTLCAAYRRYQGYQCRWVNWRYIDIDLVERATSIVPDAHLMAIWERMLFDPGERTGGAFQILLPWDMQPGDYCLIEIKGPGDALQDSQKRWLRFFQAQAIPASVAWVEWGSA